MFLNQLHIVVFQLKHTFYCDIYDFVDVTDMFTCCVKGHY